MKEGIIVDRQGNEWFKQRAQLSKPYLHPPVVESYVPNIAEVAKQAVDLMGNVAKKSNGVITVDDYSKRYSLEGIGVMILFNKESYLYCFARNANWCS